MKPIISVTGLAKQYTLGSEVITGQSFREMIVGALASPFRKFKRLGGTDANQEKFWALKNVNFSIHPGEVVGVIGRNGAGKSTLLKILSRITVPTEGYIEYQGRLASLLEVGTGFHPELTGRENIYLNGAILGMSRQEISLRIDDIVEFAEVSKFLDTPVKRFSSGMYVRLAFSVAAHLDPDILVVDEVLAVGDQAFQQKCLGKLKESAGKGRTVLFVSHNMTAVKNLCTRIIYLKDGEIEFDGNPSDAISEYLSTDKSDCAKWSDEKNVNSHLKRVSLSNKKNANTNLFQYTEEIRVLIDVEKMNHMSSVTAVRVTDTFGNILLTSWNKDGVETLGVFRSHSNTFTCTLPAKLLRPSDYTLTVFIRTPSEKGILVVEEANLSITISAEQCPIRTDRLGLIAPTLQWQQKELLSKIEN